MKFFKCDDGTIFSIKDILFVEKNDEDTVYRWYVLFNTYCRANGISITKADYERLVRVLEEEGMFR